MSRLQITEEKTPEGVRRIYSTLHHVQRIEELREGPNGKLVSVLDFGNNTVSEIVTYVPANSSIAAVTYKRKHTGRNHVAPRAEAVKHVRHIEDLFRSSYPELTLSLPAYQSE